MNFGLLGYPLTHSFSKTYFTEKFRTEKWAHTYENYEYSSLSLFFQAIENSSLSGFNVTIPYKEQIIPFLDEIDPIASEIGSVNVVLVKNGTFKGYNTDYIGFKQSLLTKLEPHHQKALILGTGGSSKAVQYALKSLKIPFLLVSRHSKGLALTYDQIDQNLLKTHQIIVQCTPLGMFPLVDECPIIPYEYMSNQHLLFDLIYNPAETLFLQKGREKGAHTINGRNMLEIQAQESWKIWMDLKAI